MKFSGRKNNVIIDLDEARTLAAKQVSDEGNTVEDKKIELAQAVLALLDNVRKGGNTRVIYGGDVEL